MRAPTANVIRVAMHGPFKAVDYRAVPDRKIYAPEDGKITAYGDSGTCGNRLELTAGENRHGFCHLESASVKVGDNIKKGQVLGIMGYTGYTEPSGPGGRHLHWVIRRGGQYVYPPILINEPFGGTPMAAQDVIVDEQLARKLAVYGVHRPPDYDDPSFAASIVGKPLWQAIDIVVAAGEWQGQDAKIKAPNKYKPVTKQLYEEG